MGKDARFNAQIQHAMRAHAAGAKPIERFGRPLVEGGSYTMNFPQPPIVVVTNIVPALDVEQPGVYRVSFRMDLTLLIQGGVPAHEFMLVALPVAKDDQPTESTDTAGETDGGHIQEPASGLPDQGSPATDAAGPGSSDQPATGPAIVLTD